MTDEQKQEIGSALYKYRKGITKDNIDNATKDVAALIDEARLEELSHMIEWKTPTLTTFGQQKLEKRMGELEPRLKSKDKGVK